MALSVFKMARPVGLRFLVLRDDGTVGIYGNSYFSGKKERCGVRGARPVVGEAFGRMPMPMPMPVPCFSSLDDPGVASWTDFESLSPVGDSREDLFGTVWDDTL